VQTTRHSIRAILKTQQISPTRAVRLRCHRVYIVESVIQSRLLSTQRSPQNLHFVFVLSRILHIERLKMTLEVGDHVWYWNSNISLDKNIPRAQWFPGSNPAIQTTT